jgi:CDP-paratose 2-epimerase
MSLLGGDRPVLITGGAGFVGANLAEALLGAGDSVRILDDLSRPGVEENLAALEERYGGAGLETIVGDVTDAATVGDAVDGVGAVFHLAAQVAVTTSVDDPVHDFRTNVLGSLHLLEALRGEGRPVPLVFTSTNKVYGELGGLDLHEGEMRYDVDAGSSDVCGVSESAPLDFRSPYGCSKGAADQYVLDYARTYGLPAVVFRMSCIYGPHQFGTEDQGWVAHFLIRALEGRPITIYGDGKQVRDVLFVSDLVDALRRAAREGERLAGQAFNIGGGTRFAVSLLELVEHISELEGGRPTLRFAPWRIGDQRHYVSDTRRFEQLTGWRARVGVRDGLAALHDWLVRNGRVPARERAVARTAR